MFGGIGMRSKAYRDIDYIKARISNITAI